MRVASIRHAMIGQLKNPSVGFEEGTLSRWLSDLLLLWLLWFFLLLLLPTTLFNTNTLVVCDLKMFSVIQNHFLLKGNYICTQIEGWIEEADSSPTNGHKSTLVKLLGELKIELAKIAGDIPKICHQEYKYSKYEF